MHTQPRPSARRGRRRFRRWPRRVLLTANLAVAAILVVSAAGYAYVHVQLDHVHTGSAAGLATGTEGPADTREASDGLAPENILLIGNETRAGQVDVNFGNASELTGTLSDVIMIVHLNPRTSTATLLSIPRDVFAPMPAGSPVGTNQKIDAALNDGRLGPNNLADAISQDFGIRINHYVEVDFDGFLATVNALGGIKMDFPERLYDAMSGLDITHTGCQLLGGQQALALVRSRHLQYDPPGVSATDVAAWPSDPESDLARIVRDHIFVRVLAKTAGSQGLLGAVKLNDFLSSVLSQLTIDPALKDQMIALALHYGTAAANAPAETIPVTQVLGSDGSGYYYEDADIGDVEFPDEPADLDAIRRWDPGALPVATKPANVEIFNIAGTNDLAATTGQALQADGFHVTTEADGTDPAPESETIVQYHPGQAGEGYAVLRELSGSVIMQSDASVPAGTVEVQAGSTFAVLGATSAPTGTTSTTTAGGSATSVPSSTGSSSTTTPTTVPTPGGQTASSATDQVTPYDPEPC